MDLIRQNFPFKNQVANTHLKYSLMVKRKDDH